MDVQPPRSLDDPSEFPEPPEPGTEPASELDDEDAPAEAPAPGRRRRRRRLGARGRLRLAISIPALMVLFTLAQGLVSLQLFDHYWPRFLAAGAGRVAGEILESHLESMLVFSVLAFVTGVALAFAITRPIEAMRETVARIAEGRLDSRAPRVPASPEFGDLSRSFDSMLATVHETIRQRDRYLLEGILSGVLTADARGRVTALNSAGARILRLEPAKVVGRTHERLLESLPSGYRAFWKYLLWSLRDERGTPDRDAIDLDVGGGRVELMVARTIQRDVEGRVAGVMINFRDASDVTNLRLRISRTDRLATLGAFAMGLAHEVRNPLGTIKGVVQLLRETKRDDAETRSSLDMVIREVDRIDRFVGELNDLSAPASAPPRECRIEEVLRAATQQVRGVAHQYAEKGIRVEEAFDPVPPVRVEPGRLARAFANILRNAYESAPPGATIRLGASVVREEGGARVVARISNTGSTIPPEERARVFEPFYTTKDRGTGLGLAIARQIVVQQEGTLDVAGDEDEAAFLASFPALPESASSAPEATPPAPPEPASESARPETAAT